MSFSEDAYACAKGAHALVIVTEWEQFRALDLKEMAAIMASPVSSSTCAISTRRTRSRVMGFCTAGSGGRSPWLIDSQSNLPNLVRNMFR